MKDRNHRMVQDDDGEQELLPEHIGIVAFHREQVGALRKALGPALHDAHVETANRFQGLERKVILALHPLSLSETSSAGK